MMPSVTANLRIVLVGTQGSGNVGSVARLCSNFDVGSLHLVNPECDPENTEAQKFACHHSLPWLRNARRSAQLGEAVAGCHAVVGFSRRPGDLRQQKVSLEDLAALVRQGEVALVFGREDNGLLRDELLTCTAICSIATAEPCPSMNLSHAVAVVLARVYAILNESREDEPEAAGPRHRSLELATADAVELMISEFERACHSIGLDRAGNPGRMMPYIRRLFQRTRMSNRELGVLRLFLSHVLSTRNGMGSRSDL